MFCLRCETPNVVREDLGCITDDGSVGRVAGFACRACGYIWEAPGAPFIPEGHVDLRGMSALEWLLTGLNAAGCGPRPRG